MSEAIFYTEYRLLKDTPKTNAGDRIKWAPFSRQYVNGSHLSRTVTESFDRKLVESSPEWFEPVGEPQPLYPVFPMYVFDHVYIPEIRHNDACRFCLVMNSLMATEEFTNRFAAMLKECYEQRVAELLEAEKQ